MIVSNLTEHLAPFLGDDGEPFANGEKILSYGWNYPTNGNQNPTGYYVCTESGRWEYDIQGNMVDAT